MTTNGVLQAALYALTTITSVAALGLALFGSGAVLERWLDGTDLGEPIRARSSVRPRPVASTQDEGTTQAQDTQAA